MLNVALIDRRNRNADQCAVEEVDRPQAIAESMNAVAILEISPYLPPARGIADPILLDDHVNPPGAVERGLEEAADETGNFVEGWQRHEEEEQNQGRGAVGECNNRQQRRGDADERQRIR